MTMSDSFEEYAQCPKCEKVFAIQRTPHLPHYGKIVCDTHGHSWAKKPDALRSPKRKTNAALFNKLPDDLQGFCWACGRDEVLLEALRPSVSLQVHHIIEVTDGGGDDRDNLMLLCGECHAEVHRRRESFRRYMAVIDNAVGEAR